jgi:ComF family protein
MLHERFRQIGKHIHDAIKDQVLQFVLPETCAGCGRTGTWFCEDCESFLEPASRSGCWRCARRGARTRGCERCGQLFPDSLRYVRSGFKYDGPVRRAIQRFKYNGEFKRGEDLGERLADMLSERKLLPIDSVAGIVPVPLHPRRLRARGFNQSEILAQCIASRFEKPVLSLVERRQDTTPQVRLRAEERIQNVEKAFAVDSGDSVQMPDGPLIIVDDVMTTGSTISAVASVLQNAGSEDLFGLTLAREQ